MNLTYIISGVTGIVAVLLGTILFWEISARGTVDKDGVAYIGNGAYQIGGDAPEAYQVKVIGILRSEPDKAQSLMAAAVAQCMKHSDYQQTMVPAALAKIYKDFAFQVVRSDKDKSNDDQFKDFVFNKIAALAKREHNPDEPDQRKKTALGRMIIGFRNLNSCVFRKVEELAAQTD